MAKIIKLKCILDRLNPKIKLFVIVFMYKVLKYKLMIRIKENCLRFNNMHSMNLLACVFEFVIENL